MHTRPRGTDTLTPQSNAIQDYSSFGLPLNNTILYNRDEGVFFFLNQNNESLLTLKQRPKPEMSFRKSRTVNNASNTIHSQANIKFDHLSQHNYYFLIIIFTIFIFSINYEVRSAYVYPPQLRKC